MFLPSEISGNGLGEIVYDLLTPIQIKRAGLISKSREKREEDLISVLNNTIQVSY